MSGIGTALGLGGGLIASLGTQELIKTVLAKVLTEEESHKVMIKVGAYAVTTIVGSFVANSVLESTEKVTAYTQEVIHKVKTEIKNKKESKK